MEVWAKPSVCCRVIHFQSTEPFLPQVLSTITLFMLLSWSRLWQRLRDLRGRRRVDYALEEGSINVFSPIFLAVDCELTGCNYSKQTSSILVCHFAYDIKHLYGLAEDFLFMVKQVFYHSGLGC